MSDAKTIMEMIKENDISYVDLRFTDPRGKMQHVTQHIDTIDEETLAEGFMFDGSSIAGWKAINESDMKLMPDLSRAYVDPFFSQTTAILKAAYNGLNACSFLDAKRSRWLVHYYKF